MNAGDRAAFQKTQMSRISAITKSKGDDVVELRMDLTGIRTHLEKDDAEVAANLDALIARLWNANSVPDKITLSMARQASDVASTSSSPVNTEAETITVDLQTTSAYHRVKYKNASVKEKGKVIGKRAAIIGRHALVSFSGLPAQAVAQYNLRKTRAALNKATELSHGVRQSLTGISQGVPESDSRLGDTRMTEEAVPMAQLEGSDSELDFYSCSSGSPRTTEEAVLATPLGDSDSESDYYGDSNELFEDDLSVSMAVMTDGGSSETPAQRPTVNEYEKRHAIQDWLMKSIPVAAQRPR